MDKTFLQSKIQNKLHESWEKFAAKAEERNEELVTGKEK